MDSAPGNDDADIDAMLGDTFAKVGISPTVAAASRELERMLNAARGEPKPRVDPKTLPVRFTRLKAFALSAAHYELACQDGCDETIAMRMGSAFHASLFRNREVLCYEGRRAGKAWERFEKLADERNAVVLNEKEYAIAMGMVGAVRRHDRAMELLYDTTTLEMPLDWAIGKRACRSTPDSFQIDTRLVELKSTRCAEPRWFNREALKRYYHCQLEFYADAIEHFGGKRPADSYIVAVENVAPYSVVVVRLPDEVREVGQKLNRIWWEQLQLAEELNEYRGYVEHDVELQLAEDQEPLVLEVDGELMTI